MVSAHTRGSIIINSEECERVFSPVNLIKTHQSNRLKEETLNSHLNISNNCNNQTCEGKIINNAIQSWEFAKKIKFV